MNTNLLPSLVPKIKPIFDYLNNFIETNYLMILFIVLLVCITSISILLFIKNEKFKSILVTTMSIVIVVFISFSFIILVNNYFH